MMKVAGTLYWSSIYLQRNDPECGVVRLLRPVNKDLYLTPLQAAYYYCIQGSKDVGDGVALLHKLLWVMNGQRNRMHGVLGS